METIKIIIEGDEKSKEKALYGLLKSLTDIEIGSVLDELGNSYLTRFARLIHGRIYRRLP